MKTINDYAYKSRLKCASPALKILFGFLSAIICISFGSVYLALFTLLYMSFICILTSEIKINEYIKIMLIPFSFIVLGVIPILMHIGTYEKGYIGIKIANVIIGTNLKNITTAAVLILRALASVSCMYFISLSTTMNDIFEGFRRIRLPKLILSLMELIYRYIYVLYEESVKIRTAQRSRLGYTSFRNSVVCTAKLAASLFIKAYSRCDRVYNSLLSRGYKGNMDILKKEYEKSTPLNILILLYATAAAFLIIAENRWFF